MCQMRTRRSKSTQGIQRSPLTKPVQEWEGPSAEPLASDDILHQVVPQLDYRLVARSPKGGGICPVQGSTPNRHSPARMAWSSALQVVRVSHQVNLNVIPNPRQEEVELNTTKEVQCTGAQRATSTSGEILHDALDEKNPVFWRLCFDMEDD